MGVNGKRGEERKGKEYEVRREEGRQEWERIEKLCPFFLNFC